MGNSRRSRARRIWGHRRRSAGRAICGSRRRFSLGGVLWGPRRGFSGPGSLVSSSGFSGGVSVVLGVVPPPRVLPWGPLRLLRRGFLASSALSGRGLCVTSSGLFSGGGLLWSPRLLGGESLEVLGGVRRAASLGVLRGFLGRRFFPLGFLLRRSRRGGPSWGSSRRSRAGVSGVLGGVSRRGALVSAGFSGGVSGVFGRVLGRGLWSSAAIPSRRASLGSIGAFSGLGLGVPAAVLGGGSLGSSAAFSSGWGLWFLGGVLGRGSSGVLRLRSRAGVSGVPGGVLGRGL
ncbi:hypothetical protein FKM82_027602 [Ascaphus truei]